MSVELNMDPAILNDDPEEELIQLRASLGHLDSVYLSGEVVKKVKTDDDEGAAIDLSPAEEGRPDQVPIYDLTKSKQNIQKQDHFAQLCLEILFG